MTAGHDDALFESVLESVGSSGRYQKLLLLVFLGPLNFLIAWIALSPVLLVESPQHWCSVSGRPDDTDLLAWRNITIPRTEDGSFSQCSQYNISLSEINSWILKPDFSRSIIPCQTGYEYNKDDFEATLTTRMNWVCGDKHFTAMWQSIGIAGNVFGTLFLNPLSDSFIPESPRWLLTRGRVDEAYALLSKVAEVNGHPVPATLRHEVSEISKRRQTNSGTVFELLKTPILRRRTLILTFCYVLNNLFFYGLVYNTGNINGNIFLNFFLSGLTEMPANFFGWWASLNFGRRFSQVIGFLLGTAFSALAIFTEHSPVWASISLLTASKFFITVSFLVVYLLMGELYPTSHCGRGVGFASLFASVFGTAAPYIAASSRNWYGLPFVILAGIGLCGAALSSFLPETLNEPVPQNLEEAENHLLNKNYFSYYGERFWKCASSRTTPEKTAKPPNYGGSDGRENPAFEHR